MARPKLEVIGNTAFVKLFNSRTNGKTSDEALPASAVETGPMPKAIPEIAMSAELRAMLDVPVDPRVDNLIRKLHVDRRS